MATFILKAHLKCARDLAAMTSPPDLSKLMCDHDVVIVTGDAPPKVGQPLQILHRHVQCPPSPMGKPPGGLAERLVHRRGPIRLPCSVRDDFAQQSPVPLAMRVL